MQQRFFSHSVDNPTFFCNALFRHKFKTTIVWEKNTLKLGFDGTKVFKTKIIILGAVSL